MSDCVEDPMSVSLGEKGDLLSGVTDAEGAAVADASYRIWDTRGWLASKRDAPWTLHRPAPPRPGAVRGVQVGTWRRPLEASGR